LYIIAALLSRPPPRPWTMKSYFPIRPGKLLLLLFFFLAEIASLAAQSNTSRMPAPVKAEHSLKYSAPIFYLTFSA